MTSFNIAPMLRSNTITSTTAALGLAVLCGAVPARAAAPSSVVGRIVEATPMVLDPSQPANSYWRVSLRPQVSGCRYGILVIAPNDANTAQLRAAASTAVTQGAQMQLSLTQSSTGECKITSIGLPVPGSAPAGGATTTSTTATTSEVRLGYSDKHATAFKAAFRDFGQNQFDEKIDPITGKLTITVTDVVLPGPNGLDLKVVRKYVSPDPEEIGIALTGSMAPQAYGLGWTMIVGSGAVGALRNAYRKCPQNLPLSPEKEALPQWVDSSGKAEPMVPYNYGWIAASGASVDCLGNAVTVDGLTVTFSGDYRSPILFEGIGDTPFASYPLRIEDRFGNWLQFEYDWNVVASLNPISGAFEGWFVSSFVPIKRAWASDGREITFEYASMNPNWQVGSTPYPADMILKAVHYGTYSINYEYQRLPVVRGYVDPAAKHLLLKATRADGTSWQYNYQIPPPDSTTGVVPDTQACQPGAGDWLLSSLTTPQAGTYQYTYRPSARRGPSYQCGASAQLQTSFNNSQVRRKQASDGGLWRYYYTDSFPLTVPEDGPVNAIPDVSGVEAGRVSGPTHTEIFYHYSRDSWYWCGDQASVVCTVGDFFSTGRPFRHVVYTGTSANNPTTQDPGLGTEVQRTDFTYQSAYLSGGVVADGGQFGVREGNLVRKDYLGWPKQTVVQRGGVSYSTTRQFGACIDPNNPPANNVQNCCPYPTAITETGQLTRKSGFAYDYAGYCQMTAQNVQDSLGNVLSQVSRTLRPDKRAVGSETAYGPTQANGLTQYFSYHPTGDLASKTDARGYISYFNDYKRGTPQEELHPVEVTDAANESSATRIRIARVVDDLGRITSETDGEGRTWTATYDGLHRPTTISPARAETSPIVYSYGASTDTITQGSRVETVVHDAFGRVTSYNNGIDTTSYRYDASGRRTFASYPGSSYGQEVEFDALDRPVKLKEPDPSNTTQVATTILTYDDAAATQTITNPPDQVTVLRTEAFGDPSKYWVKRFDLPEGQAIEVTRNLLGKVTRISDGTSARDMTYDAAKGYFLATETHPELGTTYYERDNNGNATGKRVGSLTAPQTIYTYDGQNRLLTTTAPANGAQASPVITNSYYRSGKLKSTSAGSVARNYVYNNDDLVISETVTVDSVARGMNYDYDGLGNLKQVSYPSGRVVDLAPDVLGRPTKVGNGVVSVLSNVTYWPSGMPKALTYANGLTQQFGEQATRPLLSSLSVGGSKMDLTYAYDVRGNLLSISDGLPLNYSRTMTYDGLDRIKSAGPESFTYTGIGDIATKTGASYTYDAATAQSSRRLVSISGSVARAFGYDSYGNVNTDGRGFSYQYDALGSLRSVTQGATNVSAYDYDGHAHMAKKASTSGVTHFVYGQNGRLFGEYDASSAHGKEYFYLGSKLVGQIAF